jgi:hypothetical protein
MQQKHPLHRPLALTAGGLVLEPRRVVIVQLTPIGSDRPTTPPDERDTEVQRGPVEPRQSTNHAEFLRDLLMPDLLRRVLLAT